MYLTQDDIYKHFQHGNGNIYFKGHLLPQVRGRGLGSFFAAIARKALPIAKKFIIPAVKRHVLQQAKKFAIDTSSDVLAGKNVKQAIKRRGKIAGRNILNSALGAKRRRKQRRDIFS